MGSPQLIMHIAPLPPPMPSLIQLQPHAPTHTRTSTHNYHNVQLTPPHLCTTALHIQPPQSQHSAAYNVCLFICVHISKMC